MSTAQAFGPPIVGQTERAFGAILERHLTGTGLTVAQWVTLSVTIRSGGTVDRSELVGRLAGALKVGEAEAEARLGELVAAQLLEVSAGARPVVEVTDSGHQLHSQIRSAVARVTERLWGDLPAQDLATAGRVLSTVLARANAELARA